MPLPAGAEPPMPTDTVSLNGTLEEAIERFKIRELCEGFPCHRDACEWTKMRALFTKDDAFPIDEFIKISEAAFAKGVRVACHRSTERMDVRSIWPLPDQLLASELSANSKRKSETSLIESRAEITITQRFIMESTEEGQTCEVDMEADCRLCFFVEKDAQGAWNCHFFKSGAWPLSDFYEKDRAIPVDPRRIPRFDDEKLASFPDGYRYLAYGQSKAYKIKMDLPQSRGKAHDEIYWSFIDWLNGVGLDEMKDQSVPQDHLEHEP
ncbi:BQ2448_5985 [Microbotryum intermedium]|uniref:BQ2448_5985 protein n=1 Tax=Microbotryum intermedium TaxID=269621 RepID=A0A238F3M5_9BASI|nr:BQ2448_5985 [Microbotryum intermedium]